MFTALQQKTYRCVVETAWQAHCRYNPEALQGVSKTAAKDEWTRGQLENATGKRSTKDCDTKRDFEAAMRHFEILGGEGITWQMKQHEADKRRILHVARQVAGELWQAGYRDERIEAAEKYDTSEAYLLAIAQRTCIPRTRGQAHIPLAERPQIQSLAELDYYQLSGILIRIKTHLRRFKTERDP